jgi:hypothetical protein
MPQLFRTNGWLAARVGKLYHNGVPLNIGTAGLDDYPSWDIAVNPRGRDREILDRVFSLRPGLFGATLSWLADDGKDTEHTDGIAAAEAVRLLERLKLAIAFGAALHSGPVRLFLLGLPVEVEFRAYRSPRMVATLAVDSPDSSWQGLRPTHAPRVR